MSEAMRPRESGTPVSLEVPFQTEDPASVAAPGEPLVVIQKPRSRGVGVVLSLVLILLASFVVYARARSGDWQGLTDELGGRWQRFVQGIVLAAIQAGSEGRELPQPASLRSGPGVDATPGGAPAVAQAGETQDKAMNPEAGPAVAADARVGVQGEAVDGATEPAVEGPALGGEALAERPAGAEGEAASQAAGDEDETQDAMESIEAEARKRNEALAQLDKVKEKEAEELAKRPPPARGQIPRGFIMPPGGMDDAFVQQQLAEAERMMKEMLKGQMRILTDQEPMFGRLLKELDPEMGRMLGLEEGPGVGGPGAGAGADDPNANWPPRGMPRVGADALEGAEFEAEMREAMRLFRALQREMLREMQGGAAGDVPGVPPGARVWPPVIRRQWRGPNGAQMFEFRVGG